MKYADKTGAAYTLILGDNEISSGRAQLKSMSDSTQKEVSINDIQALRSFLGVF
jgi:histidyl-tRNA synthetase